MTTQAELIEQIATLVRGQVLVVEAPAGAGKTYAVMQAITKLGKDAKVFVAAPTHVAVHELVSKLPNSHEFPNVRFGTTAKLAGRYLEMNKQSAELENRFHPVAFDYDLVIIDELSATPAIDLKRVLSSQCPVVLLGDRAQLPAVKQPPPQVWTDGWQEFEHRSFTYIDLEGQHRASGQLFEYLTELRAGDAPLVKSFDGARVLYEHSEFKNDFFTELAKAYNEGKDLSQYCYLAYRNVVVWQTQQAIRERVFESPDFVKGECVRVDSVPGYVKGELLTVLEDGVPSQVQIGKYLIKTNTIKTIDSENFEQYIRVVQPGFLLEYNAIVQEVLSAKDWDTYYKLDEFCSVVENANAMTVHKSQGRSIRYVWADSVDIGTRHKLRYVAYSRASKTLTVIWPYENWKPASRKFLAGYTLDQLNSLRMPIS